MNTIKNTLALTLSTLALTFAGSALAGPSQDKHGRDYNKQKINKHQVVSKTKRVVKPSKTVIGNKRVVNNRALNNRGVNKTVTHKKVMTTHRPTKIVTVKYPNKRKVVKKVVQPRFVNNNNRRYVQYSNPRINKRHHKRNTSVYRINRGDTLYRISLKTGVSVKRLVRLNALYGNKIHHLKAGQFLRLV